MHKKLAAHDVLKQRDGFSRHNVSSAKRLKKPARQQSLFGILWDYNLAMEGHLFEVGEDLLQEGSVLQLVDYVCKEFKSKGLCSIFAKNAFCISIYHLWNK